MSEIQQLTEAEVAASLQPHLALYRRKRPTYQTHMLNSLLSVWTGPHRSLLDIGGGTGVIGQCMSERFPVQSVTAVDVVDRFCPNLSIETRTYDGQRLPFGDASFDAATLNNVVHHVPTQARVNLFLEIRRVVAGPVYIKDHEARSWIDHRRLSLLDFIGNVPFSGMVQADYLTKYDWQDLAIAAGYQIADTVRGEYRQMPFSLFFPNRLELTMRWERG